MPNVIEILLKVRDEATANITKLDDKIKKLGTTLRTISRSMMRIGAIASGIFAVIMKATLDAELRTRGLSQAYEDMMVRQQELLMEGLSYADALRQAAEESENVRDITETLNYQLEMLKNTFTDFLVELGNLSDIGAVIEVLQELVDWFKNLDSKTKRYIIILIELGVVLLIAGTVLGLVSAAIAGLTASISGVPILYIIAGLSALIVVLYGVYDITRKVYDIITQIGEAAVEIGTNRAQVLADSFKEAADVIINALLGVLDVIKELLSYLGVSTDMIQNMKNNLLGVQGTYTSFVESKRESPTWYGQEEGFVESKRESPKSKRESPTWYGQEGGIVRRPTSAIIGEHGPEAVIPLRDISSVLNNIGGRQSPERGPQFKQLVVQIDNQDGTRSKTTLDMNRLIQTATRGDMVAAGV